MEDANLQEICSDQVEQAQEKQRCNERHRDGCHQPSLGGQQADDHHIGDGTDQQPATGS